MKKKTLEVDGVYIAKLYEGHFESDLIPQVYDRIYNFLRNAPIRRQMKPIIGSSEIWIKPNLTNARPPETGCITHPVAVKALLDYLVNFLKVKKPVRIVETITYHKGAGMSEVLPKLPTKERVAIEEKIKRKDPSQDMHDFGFNLLMELGGIDELVKEYGDKGFDVDILNLSKEPVMALEERVEITRKVEQLLGEEIMPSDKIKDKILENIPRVLKEKSVGLISLTLPKTHDEPQAWMTGAMKNIALGLYPKYKAFMHKELAKAMIYYYAFWKIALRDNIFGIVSGPLGQDCEGPIFGRTVDFPYIAAGSDLLKLDSALVVLVSGKPNLVNELNVFRYGQNKVGELVSGREFRKILPYALNYEPYPYPPATCSRLPTHKSLITRS
nr:DUF362 domain-containing protein [Candidatus Njordarchaeum guaymaensis]